MSDAPRGFREEDISFVREMLGHPANISGALSAVAAAAILSIPLGVGIAAIPLVLYFGAQAIASLFIPASPIFREYILRKKRAEHRESTRQHLLERITAKLDELDKHERSSRYHTGLGKELEAALQRQQRMRDHLHQLARIAVGGSSALSAYDLEKLDDATIDFLRLIYARLILHERLRSEDSFTLHQQLERLEQAAERASGADKKRIETALTDLRRTLDRRATLPVKDAAAAAQLYTMAEAFEEIYQRVTTDPTQDSVGEFLREATERLAIEEDLALSVEDEVGALTRRRSRELA